MERDVNYVRCRVVVFIAAFMLCVSAPSQSAEPPGAASPRELVSRYSDALMKKANAGYSLLVCWDHVLPQDRTSMETGFTEEAANTATAFRFLTLEQMDRELQNAGGAAPTRKPIKRGLITYDFNLPVVGYLVYSASSHTGQSQGTRAVPVGTKGGRYFVTTRAPTP
jgi:hypothetical protein